MGYIPVTLIATIRTRDRPEPISHRPYWTGWAEGVRPRQQQYPLVFAR